MYTLGELIKKSDSVLRLNFSLRAGFSIANQIKFDLRFTDRRSNLIPDQIANHLRSVFPRILMLQLVD